MENFTEREYINDAGVLVNERTYPDRKEWRYTDEKGHVVLETSDGWLFIDGICHEEPGTAEDFDTYSVEVQNGDGYYSNGHFIRYRDV